MKNVIDKIKKSATFIVALTLSVQPIVAQARSVDWLAVDLETTQLVEDPSFGRAAARSYFDDHPQESVSLTQALRNVLDSTKSNDTRYLVEALVLPQILDASSWLQQMPRAQVIPEEKNDLADQRKVRCRFDSVATKVICNDVKKSQISMAVNLNEIPNTQYAASVFERISLQGKHRLPAVAEAGTQPEKAQEMPTAIKLVSGHEGLITVDGGAIEFSKIGDARTVSLDPALGALDWSMFVRSAESLSWDQNARALKALKTGPTEVFVVTPGRISIINVLVKGSTPASASAVIGRKSKTDERIQVASSLASLDGLDYAVTHGPISGNHGGLTNEAADLIVANEVTQLGASGISGSNSFSRAKSKVAFTSVILKVVDDRSSQGAANYPLSGIRVKIAGTEFNELTNGRGEVEVRDVPVGSRLLIELSDNRGHIMPQISDVYISRDITTGKVLQPVVTARRFASIDFAARAVGVVQDMQKSSLCGTVAKGRDLLAGHTVSLDVAAAGPFYFNHLGYADVRMSSTGRDGQFCFFNIEPGPATLAIRSSQSSQVFATALGAVVGRHHEERFNIGDLKYVAATMAAVSAASEQLGSDVNRANQHDLVENGEVYAVGSGETMVPLDDGRLTTAEAVWSHKGRVWTVSSSSDFETTVQALSGESGHAGQVLKLVPNGFVNDMAYFAHTTHSGDLGSVVVEHGQLGGHGTSSVKVRLVDAFGRDVGDGWYFADSPVAKAIFFNVPPGHYAMLVETESGHWISADTVLVYSDSLSYVKTGSAVERRASAKAQASLE